MIKKIIFFSVLFAQTINAQTIRYVKEGGSGSKNGLSWTNASDDLQAMINSSAVNPSDPSLSDVVYVARGTYLPTVKLAAIEQVTNQPTTDRDKSFTLKPRIKIYGGFAGIDGETLVSRNFSVNKTILSGDIDKNDVINSNGVISGNENNAYHVLVIASDLGIYNNTQVDGFIISGGNANGSGLVSYNTVFIFQSQGGGIITSSSISSSSSPSASISSPSFINCIITNNSAKSGGGVYSSSRSISTSFTSTSTSNPQFTNCIIANNLATNGYGGGVNSNANSYSTYSTSNPSFFNCSIINNSAIVTGGTGGGLYSDAGTSFSGGSSSMPEVYNTIFWDNKKGTDSNVTGADFYLSVINNGSIGVTAVNSLLQLSQANLYTAANNNSLTNNINNQFNANPLFVAATNYNLKIGSPAIDTGNNNTIPVGVTKDLAGKNRIIGASVDIGAYEFDPTALGVNDSKNSIDVNVYPNPVIDVLTIQMKNFKQVFVYTIDGKLILQSSENQINFSKFSSGIYITKIENSNGEIVIKKIVKK